MKNSLASVMAILCASSFSFAHANDTIKGSVLTEGGPEMQFVLTLGVLFVIDERRTETYVGFKGCENVNVSLLQNEIQVGRYVEIKTSPVFNNSAIFEVNYSFVKLTEIAPFEQSNGCLINNASTQTIKQGSSGVLNRGELRVLEMMSMPSVHKVQLTLD